VDDLPGLELHLGLVRLGPALPEGALGREAPVGVLGTEGLEAVEGLDAHQVLALVEDQLLELLAVLRHVAGEGPDVLAGAHARRDLLQRLLQALVLRLEGEGLGRLAVGVGGVIREDAQRRRGLRHLLVDALEILVPRGAGLLQAGPVLDVAGERGRAVGRRGGEGLRRPRRVRRGREEAVHDGAEGVLERHRPPEGKEAGGRRRPPAPGREGTAAVRPSVPSPSYLTGRGSQAP